MTGDGHTAAAGVGSDTDRAGTDADDRRDTP
jgi:hypothetical protein